MDPACLSCDYNLGNDKFRCEVCEKTFSRSDRLATHKLNHTGEKPFKCMFCGNAFNQSSTLTRYNSNVCSVKRHLVIF